MDVFMPALAASHAMSLVASGAVDAEKASELAQKFEKSQRANFKEVQKQAEKKKKAKLKAKSGKTDKAKMAKLLAGLLGGDADDSDTASEDTSSSESDSEPEEEESPPKKLKSKAKKKTEKSEKVKPEPEPEEEPTDDETETVEADFEVKMAAMQARMMKDFEKKTAKAIDLAVANALKPKALALADKTSTPKAKPGRPLKVGASPTTGRTRKEPSRFKAGSK
jgi:hypothetical protein